MQGTRDFYFKAVFFTLAALAVISLAIAVYISI
jgi:hypothetical protein